MQGFQGIPPNTIFGGYKEVVRPDPIPNSAVKRFIADGSDCIAFARVGCRQFLLNRVSRDSVFLFYGLNCSIVHTDCFSGYIRSTVGGDK